VAGLEVLFTDGRDPQHQHSSSTEVNAGSRAKIFCCVLWTAARNELARAELESATPAASQLAQRGSNSGVCHGKSTAQDSGVDVGVLLAFLSANDPTFGHDIYDKAARYDNRLVGSTGNWLPSIAVRPESAPIYALVVWALRSANDLAWLLEATKGRVGGGIRVPVHVVRLCRTSQRRSALAREHCVLTYRLRRSDHGVGGGGTEPPGGGPWRLRSSFQKVLEELGVPSLDSLQVGRGE
jgi:hypothetical protein